MKTIVFWTNICIISLCIFFHVECEEPGIRIVTEEWAPYNYIQDDNLTGFSVEIVSELMALMGKRYDIE
ncbi:hypothetical protein [Marispirochaeta sp.]|uniref:hypothetical protein n=1 Tax=Marispirochaeta sp. TaxID=2038653 RepID=UPI0029C8E1A9|nr:hypothetical protein [Marispirochaeta sp.]